MIEGLSCAISSVPFGLLLRYCSLAGRYPLSFFGFATIAHQILRARRSTTFRRREASCSCFGIRCVDTRSVLQAWMSSPRASLGPVGAEQPHRAHARMIQATRLMEIRRSEETTSELQSLMR